MQLKSDEEFLISVWHKCDTGVVMPVTDCSQHFPPSSDSWREGKKRGREERRETERERKRERREKRGREKGERQSGRERERRRWKSK